MDLPYGPPEERPAAPAPLDRVQEFVNTRVNLRESGDFRDEVSSPESLRDWLSARGLVPTTAQVSSADLDQARVVREGLRALLARHNDAALPSDSDTLAEFDDVVAMLPLRVTVRDEAEPVLVPVATPGVSQALATFLADIVEARSGGTLSRLKACRDPACRWAFYDSSKNRSGTWCSMAICGSASKKRQFSERRRQRRQQR